MKIYFSITFSSYTNLSRKANHFPVYFFAPANVSEILILSPNIAFRDRLWYTVVAEADFQNRRSKNEKQKNGTMDDFGTVGWYATAGDGTRDGDIS